MACAPEATGISQWRFSKVMSSFQRACLILLACVGATACTIYPYNNEVIAHTTDSVPFLGCSVEPSHPITIQSQSIATGEWQTLGSIEHASATVSQTDSTGLNWYCWTTNRVIPQSAWAFLDFPIPNPMNIIPMARVRVLDNGGTTWTFENDPKQCPQTGRNALTNQTPCALSPTFADGTVYVRASAR